MFTTTHSYDNTKRKHSYLTRNHISLVLFPLTSSNRPESQELGFPTDSMDFSTSTIMSIVCRHNKFVDRARSYVLTHLPIGSFQSECIEKFFRQMTDHRSLRTLGSPWAIVQLIDDFHDYRACVSTNNHHFLRTSARSLLSRYYVDTTSSRQETKEVRTLFRSTSKE